jgi:hypothetical protein
MFLRSFLKFLLSDRRDSSPIGVFSGGESFASIIFDAWMGPILKTLNFSDFSLQKRDTHRKSQFLMYIAEIRVRWGFSEGGESFASIMGSQSLIFENSTSLNKLAS